MTVNKIIAKYGVTLGDLNQGFIMHRSPTMIYRSTEEKVAREEWG